MIDITNMTCLVCRQSNSDCGAILKRKSLDGYWRYYAVQRVAGCETSHSSSAVILEGVNSEPFCLFFLKAFWSHSAVLRFDRLEDMSMRVDTSTACSMFKSAFLLHVAGTSPPCGIIVPWLMVA